MSLQSSEALGRSLHSGYGPAQGHECRAAALHVPADARHAVCAVSPGANATNGKSTYLSLAYQDLKIRVVGTAAIVRFHWVAESQAVADGKKSTTNLHILMNWQKQGADWKLLSRAATKL